jgi:hypothetical protein
MSNYGKNGYDGASSDTPGEHTSSNFLPQADLAAAKDMNVQTREVSDKQYPTAHGHRNRSDDPVRTIPGALIDSATDPERQPD